MTPDDFLNDDEMSSKRCVSNADSNSCRVAVIALNINCAYNWRRVLRAALLYNCIDWKRVIELRIIRFDEIQIKLWEVRLQLLILIL